MTTGGPQPPQRAGDAREWVAVAIGPFTRADIPEVFALWHAAEGIGLFGDTPERIAACLERSPGLSFVARAGTELVGAALCTHDGRRGYLHHVAVAAPYRGRGIGRALAERALAGLRAAGIPRCHLFVQRDNEAAVGFWDRLGWKERRDIVMMTWTLDPGA